MATKSKLTGRVQRDHFAIEAPPATPMPKRCYRLVATHFDRHITDDWKDVLHAFTLPRSPKFDGQQD